MQSYLPDKIVIRCHLPCKLACGANEQPAKDRRGNRIILPAKRGDKIIKVDLGEDVELRRHFIHSRKRRPAKRSIIK